MSEIEVVLKDCPSNKSPGLDGLPYEFFKAVWPIIGEDFKAVIHSQLSRGELIDSDKIGATRLVHNVKGTPQVDELRPITLLNVDYKILSKVLVRRIRPVLPNL